ncbi:MAG: hypothetical protein LBR29_02550 [Methylobacteriaceae bacterium]|nr:hypothetical protein [Methylobacteriaceae bacterium]
MKTLLNCCLQIRLYKPAGMFEPGMERENLKPAIAHISGTSGVAPV